MAEITLESLAGELAEVRREIAILKAKDATKPLQAWRASIGMFDTDPAFMEQVIAEGRAIREAERTALG
jgi:hypothetical protein